MCSPAVFDPLSSALGDAVIVDAFSWMMLPGPWDIPAVADAAADHIRQKYSEPVLVAGHSTGGAIALQLALEEPELISGLLLLGTGAHMRGHGDVSTILARIQSAWGCQLWGDVIDRSFHLKLDTNSRNEFINWVRNVDRHAAFDVLSSQAALDFSSRLHHIDVPVTVVIGEHDPTRTVAQAREFADMFTDARLDVTDCGHTPMYEVPHRVAASVSALIQDSTSR